MNSHVRFIVVALAIALVASLAIGPGMAAAPDDSGTAAPSDRPASPAEGTAPVTLNEARGQARLLHETIHTTLQIVHRQYYREDEGLALPASTLETVFDELEASRNIKLHWLAVDAQPMSVDHKPRNDFEKNAVAALKAGQESFELAEGAVFRHVGVITLSNQCLKCHLPARRSTKARKAALVITLPLKHD